MVLINDLDRHLETVIPEWSSDENMFFYMTNFRPSRSVNPHEWDTKIHLWERVVHEACEYKNVMVVKMSQLRMYMTRTSRDPNKFQSTEIPLGWMTVINEMQKMGNLIELSEFKSLYATNGQEQGIGGWFIKNVLIKPASWMFSSQSNQSSASNGSFSSAQSTAMSASSSVSSSLSIEDDKSFVVMKQLISLVDGLVNKVYRNKTSYLDLMLCPSELKELYFSERFKLSTSNIHLILNYITREGPGTVIHLSDNRRGLRLYDSPADRTSDAKIMASNQRFEESYRGIIQLKETLNMLEKQQQRLRDTVHELTMEATDLIKKNQRSQAKYAITRKKLLEKVAEKREKYLLNIHQLVSQIEQSNTDQEVLQTLREGSQCLNIMNENLTNMDVESTLDEVAQSMTDFSDVQRVMSMGMEQIRAVSELEFDEEELLEELSNLSLETKEEATTAAPVSTQANPEPITQTVNTEELPQEKKEERQPTPDVIPSKEQPVEASPKEESEPAPVQQVVNEEKSQPQKQHAAFPQASDIPVESVKVIEYELNELKKETQPLSPEKTKVRDHLNLSLKLIRLKLKKYQKNKNMKTHVGSLNSRIEECEQKATKMQTDGRSDDGLRIMNWITLMEEEIDELEPQTEQASTTETKKQAVAC